jgi:hypothetical protein
MAMLVTTDRAEFERLMLLIERDLLAQATLRTLLTSKETRLAAHREELRAVTARITRSAM